MQVSIGYGRDSLTLEIPEPNLVSIRRRPAVDPIVDLESEVRQALQNPIDFPALFLSLIPDDRVAILLDEQIPQLPVFLTAILDHISHAHVSPQAITLICPPTSTTQPWVDQLPDRHQEIRVEVHDPTDRRKLSYLATTRHGRRIYLNRTVLDANQIIILSRRGYDSFLGYSGGAGDLFPRLSDEATRREAYSQVSLDPPGQGSWPWRKEAAEVAWLVGAPFLLQVIEGRDGEILHVLGGMLESSRQGESLLDARWQIETSQPADIVVATISGDPNHHSFADLARALSCAARVVKPNGKIVLLCSANPELGPCAKIMRTTDEPHRVSALLREQKPPDLDAGLQWMAAAQQARIYLLSHMDPEVTEELFATPLDNAQQVQRLLLSQASCLFINDAHKTLALIQS